MSHFQKAIRELIRQETRGDTHAVMGYVPAGSVPNMWTTTVRIPHPHGGIHRTSDPTQRYLEFKDVPMPYTITGVITAIQDMFLGVDRQVSVGFRGASLTEPYIISYQSPVHEVDDKAKESTPNRNGVVAQRATQAGGSHTHATASPTAQSAQQQSGVAPARQVLTNKGTAPVQDVLAMSGGAHALPAKDGAAVTVAKTQAALSTRLAAPLSQALRRAQVTVPAVPPAPLPTQEKKSK